MDKEKLGELFTMLQDAIIEAIKNPTSENVRFVTDASMFMRTVRGLLLS